MFNSVQVQSWSKLISSNRVGFLVAVEKHGTEHRDSNGAVPLYAASAWGDVELVKLLINNKKADVNITGRNSCLAGACYYGHNEVVEILTQKGALVNNVDSDHSTPIIFACRKGHLEVVKTLCKAGADINVKNVFGRDAISTARLNEQHQIVNFLEKLKANGTKKSIEVTFEGELQ